MVMIGLLTPLLICVTAELFARTRFYDSVTGLDACLNFVDLTHLPRGFPNTVCRLKVMESADIEYRMDSRGYRSAGELGPKHPDVYRIVMVGSSIVMGLNAPIEQTIASQLQPRLEAITGRKIEIYNEGMSVGFTLNTARRFQDAIDLQPDLILWIVTPHDIVNSEEQLVAMPVPAAPVGAVANFEYKLSEAIRRRGGDIILGRVLRHYIYEFQSADQATRSLMQGKAASDESGFLVIPRGSAWKQQWTQFSGHLQDMARRSRAASIPFAVSLAPNRLQAAMISAGNWPRGYDPLAINAELRGLAQENNAQFVDILPHFREAVDGQRLFLPLDGHPNSKGYAFLTDTLVSELSTGQFPALKAAGARR